MRQSSPTAFSWATPPPAPPADAASMADELVRLATFVCSSFCSCRNRGFEKSDVRERFELLLVHVRVRDERFDVLFANELEDVARSRECTRLSRLIFACSCAMTGSKQRFLACNGCRTRP